jgi:hypothetical protein
LLLFLCFIIFLPSFSLPLSLSLDACSFSPFFSLSGVDDACEAWALSTLSEPHQPHHQNRTSTKPWVLFTMSMKMEFKRDEGLVL